MAVEYKPHPRQIAAHKAFLTEGYKYGTLFWGRQVGKTMWSVYQAWIAAVMNQGQYFIVFKTYSQAAQVVWKQYLHTIPKELIAGKQGINNDDLRVTFNHLKGPVKLPGVGWVKVEHDPELPPSSIRLLGSDQADSHRGNKAHGIIFDEYADQNPVNWDEVYQWFLTTTKGWAVFMGTPKGYNHWYDMLQYANLKSNGWYFSKATWRDNPAISADWVAERRREAEQQGKLNSFLQEMELEFRAVQGSVYPTFKRSTHTCAPEDIPDQGTDYVVIDFGYAEDHPLAVNFIRVDVEDRWWVYDEIHVIKTELDVVIEDIKRKMVDRRITAIVGDGARVDLIAYMQGKGLPVVPGPKGTGSIVAGIDLLRIRMRPRIMLVGDPKPQIVFSTACKHTILDFEQYKYAEVKKDRPPSEVPIKHNDDHCFVGYTLIKTTKGNKAIANITSDDVLVTPLGPSRVLGCKMTGKKQVVGYGKVVCTPDHKILTQKGIVPIDSLRYTDKIWLGKNQKQFTITEYLIAATLTVHSDLTEFIIKGLLTRSLEAKLASCTETYGKQRMAQYLKDMKSIIKTGRMTTRLKRLNVLLRQYTLSDIVPRDQGPTLKACAALDVLLRSGMVLKKGADGMLYTHDRDGQHALRSLDNVTYVVETTILPSLVEASSVLELVKPQHLGDAEVYNLASENGMYYAGDVLVSNCDAIRYLALYLKTVGTKKDKDPPKLAFNEYGLPAGL